MTPTGYRVVYDVTRDGWAVFWFPAVGIGFILLGGCLSWLAQREPKWRHSWGPRLGLIFAVLWTLGTFVLVGGNFVRDYRALSSGHADHVEGPVENFIPMPASGHGEESFSVQGVSFSYSDFVVTPGFNKTTFHNGPMRADLYVRIWYHDGDILKLEIRD
jgi:hypothetical protein